MNPQNAIYSKDRFQRIENNVRMKKVLEECDVL